MQLRLTWVLAICSLSCFGQSLTPAVDTYGGLTARPCAAGRAQGIAGRWSTQLASDGKWQLCDPSNNAFRGLWAANINEANSGTDNQGATMNARLILKYPNVGHFHCWYAETKLHQLQDWGFNGMTFPADVWALGYFTDTSCNGQDGWASGSPPHRTPAVGFLDDANVGLHNDSSLGTGVPKELNYLTDGATAGFSQVSFLQPDEMDPVFISWINGALNQSSLFQDIGLCFTNNTWCIAIQVGERDIHHNLASAYADSSDNSGYGGEESGRAATDPAYLTLVAAPFAKGNASGLTSLSPGASSNVYFFNTDVVAAKAGLEAFLQAEYGTIGALNAAWGTSYTQWDSTRTVVTGESAFTGDGATTSFTHNLAHANVDPYSIQYKVAGVLQGLDCPGYVSSSSGMTCSSVGGTKGKIIGKCTSTSRDPCVPTNPITAGDVTYSTGVNGTPIAFTSAPANGAAGTVDYDFGGYKGGGTGFMDEDGTNVAADFTEYVSLTAANSHGTTIAADLHSFLYSASNPDGTFWGYYFHHVRSTIKAIDANMLYGCFYYTNGGARGLSHDNAYKAMGAYCDFIGMSVDGSSAFNTSRMNRVTQNLGDIPIMVAEYVQWFPDSRLSGKSDGGKTAATYWQVNTAGAAGNVYYTDLTWDFGYKSPTTNHYPVMALSFWSVADQFGATNNGLLSTADNPYDGNCNNNEAIYTDVYGFSNANVTTASDTTCYGGFLPRVIEANRWAQFNLLGNNQPTMSVH